MINHYEISSRAGRYFSLFLVSFLALWLFIMPEFDTMALYQISTVLFTGIALFYGRNITNIRSLITLIAFFHVIMIIATDMLPYDLVPYDGITYDSFGRRVANSDDFWAPLIRMVQSNYGVLDISDIGYTYTVAIFYYLFGQGLGVTMLCVLKVFAHLLTCVLIYKFIRRWLDKDSALLSTLLFGINTYVEYWIFGGLKENIFCLIVILTLFQLYKTIENRNILNIILFVFLSFLTLLFRGSYPYYFVVAFVAYYILIKSRPIFLEYSLVGLLIITFAASLFVSIVSPEHLGGVQEREMTFQGSNVIINYLGPFISPFPSIGMGNQMVNLVTISFSVLNMAFGLFATLGIWRVIRTHDARYYPMLFVFLLNAVMINLMGFSINARFSYPVLCIYYMFIPLGLQYYFKPKIYLTYILLAVAIVYMYNVR